MCCELRVKVKEEFGYQVDFKWSFSDCMLSSHWSLEFKADHLLHPHLWKSIHS